MRDIDVNKFCAAVIKAADRCRGIEDEKQTPVPVDNYTGFRVVGENNYELLLNNDKDFLDTFLINQYALVENAEHEIIDAFRVTADNTFQQIKYPVFESIQFGTLKPKDVYQKIAMDSLLHNQITMLRGPAGSGKSYIALSYLFQAMEKGIIDKIVIFCNTVATMGSAKLGFYPGTRDEKLLDSQIGAFLSSKLGDSMEVRKLLNENRIILLPMSDIRGYDTTGMKAGIYITEAQNLDIDLMKLALQRIGEDSICVLDGDDTAQVDMEIYAGERNGLRRASKVFRGHDFYGEVTLQKIQRSRIAMLAQDM